MGYARFKILKDKIPFNWTLFKRPFSLNSVPKNRRRPKEYSNLHRHDEEKEHEEFYRCSTKRWLYNEQRQLALRYMRFNVHALQKIAANAVGANKCISMVKTAEGSFNKIFTLRFENGKEVIARIPCPISGPPHLVVASEVATLDFVRTHMQIPSPKVLAWSSRRIENEVGAEYIIMEKVPGVPLADRWPVGRPDVIKEFILRMVGYEKRFSDFRFSQIGSLYFKEDVDPVLQARRLYADGVPDDEASERYRIGPTLQREFWRGERMEMVVDRGPWPDTQSYALALIECERLWLETYARPRALDDPFRISDEEEDPKAHIKMLDRFSSIIPYITSASDIFQHTLWHADLHEGNILVDGDGSLEVLGIIDWQEWIGPQFLRAVFPRMFTYEGDMIDLRAEKPNLPEGFDSFPEDKQAEARAQLRRAARHRIYEYLIQKHDPTHFQILNEPHLSSLSTLFRNVPRSWSDGLAYLRQALIQVAICWREIAGSNVECPLTFTPEELQSHVKLSKRLRTYEYHKTALHELLRLDPDGEVDAGCYEEMKMIVDRLRHKWVEEREGGPWPLQDGAWSSLF